MFRSIMAAAFLLFVPASAAAQGVAELEAVTRSGICPANPATYELLDMTAICQHLRDASLEKLQCHNKVIHDNAAINRYNSFMHKCRSARQREEHRARMQEQERARAQEMERSRKGQDGGAAGKPRSKWADRTEAARQRNAGSGRDNARDFESRVQGLSEQNQRVLDRNAREFERQRAREEKARQAQRQQQTRQAQQRQARPQTAAPQGKGQSGDRIWCERERQYYRKVGTDRNAGVSTYESDDKESLIYGIGNLMCACRDNC